MIIHEDEEYILWDAHTHFSNLVARPLKFFLKKLAIYEVMDKIFSNMSEAKKNSTNRIEKNMKLYEILLDFYHLDKAIHLPVFKFDRKLSYSMNKASPERIFGFGYIIPHSKRLDEDLQELVENRVPGIKIHPDIGKFTYKACAEELIKIFQFCAENKIIVLSHTGSHSILENIIPILKKCDETIFIMGHSGLCPQVSQALKVARECPNSYLEISGNPYTYQFMKAIKDPDIGVERILFGTDLPSLNPRVEIEKVFALDVSTEEKKLIFSGNLQQVIKNANINA